jgi:hypothetical protein
MQDRELPTFSFDADFQVESYLRLPRLVLCRALRRQRLSLSDAAMDYFDIAADHGGVLASVHRHQDALLRGVVHLGLAVPDFGIARAGACAERRRARGVSFAEIETDRGHDAFLLEVPEFFEISRAFLQSAGSARGLKQGGWLDMSLSQQSLPSPASSRTAPTIPAAIISWSPRWCSAARKVLDVGCGDGELLQLLESRGIDGRGIELSREGVNRCVGKGLAVVQGDADTDLVNYPTTPLIT